MGSFRRTIGGLGQLVEIQMCIVDVVFNPGVLAVASKFACLINLPQGYLLELLRK
jgi:hypothetical protein